ncbi:triphosphoribosyl-dephospho-CoA synthase [Crenothrix polyspora]|uniref:Triphosphoribosyl-dephospho-CoA protein n=1 Tax=Crenothrix polyspora TaxID=360316 RepID=A0A1R4H223_9GAMM|nr:triphosphoribosyl-dephospho-CoA synthase [Crenothrix polyspora]SJM90278.1 Triphosphoribosyl-dephospho-CoA protein [Crenothrix polyspora]
MLSAQQLRELYQQACELELQAFKPGNVSVYSEGHDMTVADFRISAKVSAEPLCNPAYTLGEKIYYAVKATREAVHCNTNLGILLLCAPLITAASQLRHTETLRQSLSRVLATTTLSDADWVFKAIALAAPGGLGSSNEQDVNQHASVTLTEAMRLASDKDRIAQQYSNDYKIIFDFSLPIYYNYLDRWEDRNNWAVVALYANLLNQYADSHIERKYGDRYSGMVAEQMTLLKTELEQATHPEYTEPLLRNIDQQFKSKKINPGTTADLTVAAVLTAFIEIVKLKT